MSSKYLFMIVCCICFTHESHSSTCMSDNDVGNIGCVQIGSEFSHPQNAICIKTTDEFMCRNAQNCWLSCVHAKYGRSKGHVPQDCRCKDRESDSVRRSHIDISCFRPDGKSCDWYVNCLEKLYPCEQDDNRYAITYAEYYCEKYGANYNAFSSTGKRWVDATRKCLQRALVPLLMKEDKPSCAEIKETAFLSHASCYAKPSSSAPSYCELSRKDVLQIILTIKSAFLTAFSDTFDGYFETQELCVSFPLSLYVTVETDNIKDDSVVHSSKIMATEFANLMQWNTVDIQYYTHFYYRSSSETTFGMSISAPAGTNLYEIRDHAVDAVRSKYIQELSSGVDSNKVLRIKDCLDERDVCDENIQNDHIACSAVGGKCQDKSNTCNLRRFKGLCIRADDICCAEDDSLRYCVAYGGECHGFESSCVSGSKLQAQCSSGTCCMPYFVGPLKITAEKIAQAAESFDGSTKWKQSGFGFLKHWKNAYRPKCNLFVSDVLLGISAAVPNRKKRSYAPIGANEWGNPSSIYVKEVRCYKLVTTTFQRGDIISFPNSQGLGHVGIITSTTHYISAQEYKIEVKPIIMDKDRVVWRYNYSDPDC